MRPAGRRPRSQSRAATAASTRSRLRDQAHRTPAEIAETDVERLREVGLDDLEILDLNNIVAYYNYINRVANGLGLRTRSRARRTPWRRCPRVRGERRPERASGSSRTPTSAGPSSWRAAAEQLGIDDLWLGDEGPARDPFALLAAAPRSRTRLRLGVAVTNPYLRHPAITAVAAMTVHELSGGRRCLGVGPGGGIALGPLGMRARPRSPAPATPCGSSRAVATGTRPTATRRRRTRSPGPTSR